MEPLTEHGLVAEVATGTFSFKNKISASSVKTLWEKLARFVADALKQQKGVLLPNLGTFSVGPVVVSQERPKYSIGGRCPVVQPNYGLLATAAAVHRGSCQRLVLELMQRLGVHILSGRAIQVAFPGVGKLFTNRAGRIQFDFDSLLREFFELERERIIPEMEQDVAAAPEGDENSAVAQVVKGLQHVHLHDPPVIRSTRPATGAAAVTPGSPSARVKRNTHAPYKGELLELWRLCKSNDRIGSGCVPRLQLEQWLYKECPQVLRQVAAATVLELLSTHTYGKLLPDHARTAYGVYRAGKSGKHIIYKPFLDQLDGATGKEVNSPQRANSPARVIEVRIDSPSSALRRRQQQQQQPLQQDYEDGGEPEVVEVTLSPVQGQPPSPWQLPTEGQYPSQPQGHYYPSPQQPYPSPQPYPSYQTPKSQLPAQGQYTQPQQQRPYAAQGQYALQGQGPQYQQYPQQVPAGQQAVQPPQTGKSQQLAPAGGPKPACMPGSAVPAWQGQGQGPDQVQRSESSGSKPYHYYQNKLSPRSRREFDNFNRIHFQKLEQVRGSDYKQRAVTPKVGEDELNLQEYQAMRRPGSGGMPTEVLDLQDDPPYSREPHPFVSAHRQRGSPGPKPQILTLAHDPPSYAVPGLPTHQYQCQSQQQQQQHPMTPGHPYPARQPTPQQRPCSGRQQQHTPAQEESPPISQYEIINEKDPIKRRLKRNELANALNRNWSEQASDGYV
ncbi:hypothetical protein VOLCADRAFT_94835 [Volvox carteri f. nagariensis]|uniref:CCDC81 HU domain-containing protein n=1 Tax=Volvox carteri f. nagariensis TaxID=3068 RepID=D8U5W4_VOLCA|nr:uncharacterized protein VOLCADRAFT_94835 [Volvox carteri f. nagariensis]EFJ44827.1 hypothetical protein VOLCADRAFT_94835 [Volvox carteri f. nagariensis]|eukprot:XP_002954110.1 hypothetical protein VOLCADRAFT_94835 [Volvox carteri f. nagariensis]